jgi:hypothetical protein
MHPALTNPFLSFGRRDASSLPSGETEPSVTLACASAENQSSTATGGHQERPVVRPPEHNRAAGRTESADQYRRALDRLNRSTDREIWARASVRARHGEQLATRFVLDEDAFFAAIEPPPLFLQRRA